VRARFYDVPACLRRFRRSCAWRLWNEAPLAGERIETVGTALEIADGAVFGGLIDMTDQRSASDADVPDFHLTAKLASSR
jgi:hypothetical protein